MSFPQQVGVWFIGGNLMTTETTKAERVHAMARALAPASDAEHPRESVGEALARRCEVARQAIDWVEAVDAVLSLEEQS
jgi:hypothetical protein